MGSEGSRELIRKSMKPNIKYKFKYHYLFKSLVFISSEQKLKMKMEVINLKSHFLDFQNKLALNYVLALFIFLLWLKLSAFDKEKESGFFLIFGSMYFRILLLENWNVPFNI